MPRDFFLGGGCLPSSSAGRSESAFRLARLVPGLPSSLLLLIWKRKCFSNSGQLISIMWFPSPRAGEGQRVGACLCSACGGINRSPQSPRLSIQQLSLSATFQPNTQHYCSEAEWNKLLSIRCTRVLSLGFPEAPGRAIFALGSATNCLQINKTTRKQQWWGKKWCDNICEWIMSLGRMGSDRNLSSAAATELFTAQPDGLVQQQPFRINNCFSGGRGSFRNRFAFR